MLININSTEPLYYPFTVSVNNCGKWKCGSWNITDDPYTLVCVPNKVKKNESKTIMSGIHETRVLGQHELCEFICKLNENVCTSK